MSWLKSWLWRNVIWRLRSERTTLDHLFRGCADIHFASKAKPAIEGTFLDRLQLQNLCMAPSGSHVVVRASEHGVMLTVEYGPYIPQDSRNVFYIRVDPVTKELYLYIEYVRFDDGGPHGLGAVAFYRCVQTCATIGIARIDMLAAGGKSYKINGNWTERYNGFYSWARFGCNAQLHSITQTAVDSVPHLAGCKDLLDIICIDAAWWKEEGAGGDVSFDLQEGSRSWETLRAYLFEKGLKLCK